MKTDQFDDELRRKLLGLPPETDAGDVERIFGYVSANRPGSPGMGWGRGLLYGTAGALLLGSVLYNVNQYHTNKNLYITLDSLRQQMAVRPVQPLPSAPSEQSGASAANKPDTIYVTRYRDRLVVLPQPGEPLASVSTWPDESVPSSGRAPRLSVAQKPVSMETSRPDSAAGYTAKPDSAGLDNTSGTRLSRPAESPIIRPQATRGIASAAPTRRLDKNTALPPAANSPEAGTSAVSPPHKAASVARNRRQPAENQLDGRLNQPVRSMASAPDNLPDADNRSLHPANAIINGTNRLAVLPLQSRTLLLTHTLAFPTSLPPARKLVTAKAEPAGQPARRSFHLALPNVSVANSSLFAGVGLDGGHENLSGSVLGEWRVNSHWSVQAGVQYALLLGPDFENDEHFEERTGFDFRSLYAPNVPRTNEIHDIRQTIQLLQVPLTVAYHYPLTRDWGLRFGLGTTLDLWASNRLAFEYRESSRMSEHGLFEVTQPTRLINSLTVSAGIERQWKGWLFRAGPFISPQLRTVPYKPDALYGGVQLQVLRRFGSRQQ